MITSLLILNLNITVSTILKYCYKKALNKKLKLKVSWATNFFFEKFVKPSAPAPLTYLM